MTYQDINFKIKEYLEKEDFELDNEYISIAKLKEIYYDKVYNAFYLDDLFKYFNTLVKKNTKFKDKLFYGYQPNRIELELTKEFVKLFIKLKENPNSVDKQTIEIRKDRGDIPYLPSTNSFYTLKEKEIIAKFVNGESLMDYKYSANKKINDLEHLYDLLNIKKTITSINDMDCGDYGYYGGAKVNEESLKDALFKVFLYLPDEETHLLKTKLLLNSKDNELIRRYYIGYGTINEIINNHKDELEKKIKIPINKLPNYLKVLVNEELKLKSETKKLVKQPWEKEIIM